VLASLLCVPESKPSKPVPGTMQRLLPPLPPIEFAAAAARQEASETQASMN